MHEHKIRNFTRDHPTVLFPWWRKLTGAECAELRGPLRSRLGLTADDDDGLRMMHVIEARRKIIHGADAEAPQFSLTDCAAGVGLIFPERVLLNWYRFDDIDEMRSGALSRYFDDVWYPSSDDLDIFDASLDWILSVSHHGGVSWLRL